MLNFTSLLCIKNLFFLSYCWRVSRATDILPRLMNAIFLFHHSRCLLETQTALWSVPREQKDVSVWISVWKFTVYRFPDMQQPVHLQNPPKLKSCLNKISLCCLSLARGSSAESLTSHGLFQLQCWMWPKWRWVQRAYSITLTKISSLEFSAGQTHSKPSPMVAFMWRNRGL